MARIRTIKPEFFSHEDLFTGEQETGLPLRLAYAGLWTVADREGRFKWKPMQLKTAALPYDEVDFSRVLDALATRGFIFKYEISGVFYGVILSWKVHQFINNKEPQSLIPEPPQDLIDQEVDAIATRRARDFHASLTRGVKEGKGKEGNVKEISTKPSAHSVRGANSKMAKATGGTRHTRVKELVENFYQEWAGAECPWDGGEGGQLDKLLKATPNWIDSQFVTCLENLARSDCIAVGSRPRTWLGDLMKYLKSPLDKFGKPIQGNGNGHNKAQQRELDRDAKWRAIASANPSHALSEGSGVGLRPRLEPGANRAMAVAAGNESTVHIAGNNGGVQRGTDQAARRVDGVPETS